MREVARRVAIVHPNRLIVAPKLMRIPSPGRSMRSARTSSGVSVAETFTP